MQPRMKSFYIFEPGETSKFIVFCLDVVQPKTKSVIFFTAQIF